MLDTDPLVSIPIGRSTDILQCGDTIVIKSYGKLLKLKGTTAMFSEELETHKNTRGN